MQQTPSPTRTAAGGGSPSKSLDVMADALLSQRSYRTDTLNLAPLLRPSPLPREDGIKRLRTLVGRRAWGDVLKIATGMLTTAPYADVYSSLLMLPLNAPQVDISSVSPQIRSETVEIMTLQCNAWLKLRRYQDLATEVERWNFLKQNDATAESPEWLPWSLHILAGQVQQFMNTGDQSSDLLSELRNRIPKEDSLWLVGVDNTLANVFLRKSQWRLTLASLDRILELVPSATKQYLTMKYEDTFFPIGLEPALTAAFKCEILSRQGRILLQIGALQQVAKCFERAKDVWNSIASTIVEEWYSFRILRLIPVQMEINEGLFYFAKSNYEHARQSFLNGVDLLKVVGNFDQGYDPEDWVGPIVAGCDSAASMYSECMNNLSLCSLYTCQMQDAVAFLEGVVREDPTAFLTERVAFNLCTLYELGADSAASARKKRVIQLIAKRFFLHDVGPESFRVN